MRPKLSLVLSSVILMTALAAGVAGAEAPRTGLGEAGPAEATLTGVAEVVAGEGHSCARMANRTVRCWGANAQGQLGQGDLDPRTLAVTVRNGTDTGPLRDVIDIAAGGSHSCALLSTRQVRCWGENADGQLGDSSTDDRLLPVAVRNTLDTGNLATVTQISAERDGTCAVLQNDELRCWGDDSDGQLGNGNPKADSDIPVKVAGLDGTGVLDDVRQVDGGYLNTCATLNNGQARCWGDGSLAGLGNGTYDSSGHPVTVLNVAGTGPLTGVTQISQSGYNACARLANGQARCWGSNISGELGNGTTDVSTLPVIVRAVSGTGALTGVAEIHVAFDHTCARLASGQVRCWGAHGRGQLGIGPPADVIKKQPKVVVGTNGSGALSGVTQLATFSRHTCVRLDTGQARCWGDNAYRQLGNGLTTPRGIPTIVRF